MPKRKRGGDFGSCESKRKKGREQRKNETDEEREERLVSARERMSILREQLTDEQRENVREKDRIRKAAERRRNPEETRSLARLKMRKSRKREQSQAHEQNISVREVQRRSSEGYHLKDALKTPGVEDSGTIGPLNPELVILDIKEESNIEADPAVEEEPDVREEIPSSDEEKIDIKDGSGFKHTEHRDDCQTLMREEIILIKSEPSHCAESCDCAESDPLAENDVLKTPGVEDSGTIGPLNPELVILDIQEESNIEVESAVKEEPDVKEEIPSSDDGLKTPGVEDSGTIGPLNPELVILDIQEESNIEVESAVKEEPDVKEKIPSSDEEKIDIEGESGFKHTEHRDDCQTLMKEEEIILIKSEPCHCAESCDCVKSDSLPDNDGETMEVDPLLIQNMSEELGQSRLRKPLFLSDQSYFYCGVCDYKCVRQGHIESHLRKHTGEKPFACGYCHYRASHSSAVKRHITTHHAGETMEVKNIEPLLTQNLPEELGQNRLRKTVLHSDQKYLYCDVCDYKCLSRDRMESHLRSHTGEKPFPCRYCDFRSNNTSAVKTHEMTQHTGEKPFSCKLCDYKSAQPGNVARHMMTHTGEKPFKCDSCDFRTAIHSSLKAHKLRHTGETPFKCELCQFSTTRKSNLRLHLIRAHPGPPPLPGRTSNKKTRIIVQSALRTQTVALRLASAQTSLLMVGHRLKLRDQGDVFALPISSICRTYNQQIGDV